MASVQVTFTEGTTDTWTTLTDDQAQKVCEFITTLAGQSNESRTGWSHPVSPEHPRWVNAYSVQRESGGPEEGGWWYDVGTFEHGIRCETEAEVDAAEETLRIQFPKTKQRYSVMGGRDHDVLVEDHPGKDFPDETPRYE
jgi:hypothetical protein